MSVGRNLKKVAITFQSVDEALVSMTIQMKANDKSFHVVQYCAPFFTLALFGVKGLVIAR